jgi:hypothetical protein
MVDPTLRQPPCAMLLLRWVMTTDYQADARAGSKPPAIGRPNWRAQRVAGNEVAARTP